MDIDAKYTAMWTQLRACLTEAQPPNSNKICVINKILKPKHRNYTWIIYIHAVTSALLRCFCLYQIQIPTVHRQYKVSTGQRNGLADR